MTFISEYVFHVWTKMEKPSLRARCRVRICCVLNAVDTRATTVEVAEVLLLDLLDIILLLSISIRWTFLWFSSQRASKILFEIFMHHDFRSTASINEEQSNS